MKQSIQLKASQQLRLTPQLQQAIRFLQLSTSELQKELQEALESNPLLEAESFEEKLTSKEAPEQNNSAQDDASAEPIDFETQSFQEEQGGEFEDFRFKSPLSLQSNSQWEEGYEKKNVPESLQDHLRWQLNLTHLTDRDKLIGEYIIDAIIDNGRLGNHPEYIFESVKEQQSTQDNPLEFEEFEVVRHLIQQLNPVGCACFSLKECLTVQVQRNQFTSEVYDAIKKLITKHLHLLGSHDNKKTSRLSHIKEPYLSKAISVIRSLDPYPGEAMNNNASTDYIIPDLIMHKHKDVWVISLNVENKLGLQLNNHYVKILSNSKSVESKAYLKDYLTQAKILIQSLDTRNQTLLNVGSCIVNLQQDFFDKGESAMIPLTQKQLAIDLNLHESTISRITTQKYIHTPRGVFELKYFFSTQIGGDSDGRSAMAVQKIIKELIKNEPPEKPYSDSKIAKHLKEAEDIDIARRTVAKYREILSIPTYNQRKKQF